MTKRIFSLKSIAAVACCSFLLVISFISCKKDNNTGTPVPVVVIDKAALIAKVAEAQALLDGTVEGTRPGEYVIGSKSALQSAVDAAKAIISDANATLSTVTNAIAQVQAAIDIYKTNLIAEIAAENLIGFWKMNGNANDSSGKAHNGTVTAGHPYFGSGIPTLTNDRFGRANMCYHFDHGGNIEVPYTSALNPQEMTISVWCKKDTAGRLLNSDTYTMVSLDRWLGYKYQWQSANKLFFTVHAINGADTTFYDRDDEVAVLDNEVWYHAVVTFKPGEEDFYVNGDLVKTWTDVPGSPITVSSAINFVIGQDLPTGYYLTTDPSGSRLVDYGGFWTGDLDDVMFYNVALSAAQVKSIYDNQNTL
ncbi:MAG: hypothetical protein H0W62_10210 [Chitinophagales bacterium]|nr:hypothetical protein [Chitinophagales bacterium]